MRDRLTWIAAVGWLANLVAGMIPALHYEPSLIANGPFMLILGALYGAGRASRRANGRESP
jgi:hypothetical protein